MEKKMAGYAIAEGGTGNRNHTNYYILNNNNHQVNPSPHFEKELPNSYTQLQ